MNAANHLQFTNAHMAQMQADIRRVRRQQTRIGVRWYLGHRTMQLGLLHVHDDAWTIRTLRKLYRAEVSRLRIGHWSASLDRAMGLRQAYIAERYAMFLARREWCEINISKSKAMRVS